MALAKRTLTIPLAAGLQSKSDPRALQPPGLAVCRNAEFDELGGIGKRKPYSSIGVNILGGGTLSNIRRFYEHGNELVCFTQEALYSWSVRDSAWVLKGTHLACKVSEQPIFVDPNEQILTDRCEVGDCVMYAWVNKGSGSAFVAAVDKTTGAVILAPTSPSDGSVDAANRPRLVPLANSALLFFLDGTDQLSVISLTPGQLDADVTATPTVVAASAGEYDACPNQAGTSAMVAAALGASYTVAVVSSAAAVTATASKARTADGPIAVTADPGGTRMVVARGNGLNVRGDLLNSSTLADVSVNVSLGTSSSATALNQIAACYRTVQVGGQWTCYVFWVADENSGPDNQFLVETNTFNNAGTAGTETAFRTQLGIASRAFDHNGRVYLWLVFAGDSLTTGLVPTQRAAVQNTYFLYRDDGFLVAKAATNRASGFSQLTGHLPHVQNVGSGVYAWCGGERRRITVSTGHQQSYSARAPREIIFTFDSNEARRVARLGQTLYISGGEILQYDGRQLVEVGYHVAPWYFDVAQVVAGGTNVDAGAHYYKASLEWPNAIGDLDASSSASSVTIDLGAATETRATVAQVCTTHKEDIAIRLWRSAADPTIDSPLFLVTSEDPTAGTGNNGYFTNDPTIAGTTYTIDDDMTDATAATKRSFDEVGDVLERFAPPPATIIVSTQDRLILAGVAGSPYQIWYSRLRGDSEVASFHDALVVEVPPTGGPITGLGFLNETLIAFCETAIWALPGDGFDNTGQGQNYGPARLLSSDCGAVSHESVALAPMGLMFKSSKGWYLLNKGWSVEYIGRPVAAFDSDTVAAVHVMESKHQVRCLMSSSRMLVLDYSVPSQDSPAGQWSEWTIDDGVHACIWNGTYHYASSSAVLAEQSTYSATDYSLDIETAWIKLSGYMGRGRVWIVMPLGEYRSAHDLRVRLARDYLDSDASGPTWFDSKFWTATPTTVGGPLQVRHGPSIQRVQAIKVRLTDYAVGSTTDPPAGEALRLTALELELGVEPGLWRGLPATQKQ